MKEVKMNDGLKELDEESIDKISGGSGIRYEWSCPVCDKKFSGWAASPDSVRDFNDKSWTNCCTSCLKNRQRMMNQGEGYIDMLTGEFLEGSIYDALKSSDEKKD